MKIQEIFRFQRVAPIEMLKKIESAQKKQHAADITEKCRYAFQEFAGRIRASALDAISIVFLAVTQPISLTALCDPKRKDMNNPKLIDPSKPAVLMIHGFLGRSSNWVSYRKRLADKEIKNLFTVDLGSPRHSIEHYAAVVNKRMEEIKTITGQDDVIIVAHSMGGLVADAYKKLYAQKSKTHILDTITIGTPLAGTNLGHLGAFFSKSARQMIPSSDFSLHRAMKSSQRFVDKNGIQVWEETVIDKKGVKTTFRNEIMKNRRITDSIQREDFEKRTISCHTVTRWPEGMTTVQHDERLMESERPFPKTMHIGSKYDTVVPYESSVSQAADTGVQSEILQKGAGGHVWQLFARDIQEIVYERIMGNSTRLKSDL